MKFKYLFLVVFLLLGTSISNSETIKKENLGNAINSSYDEVLPMISADEKTIFFCRKQHPNNIGEQKKDDIWQSVLKSDGGWEEPKNIGYPLNNEYSNGVCSISPDGNILFLAGDYMIDSQLVSGIFTSHRTLDGWSYPKQVKIKNFYYYGKYISYYISNSGSVLLMCLKRDDTFGGQDIYISFLTEDDEFSEPINLGPIINTKEDEDTPFLAADGVSLYFSSKGHQGYGDYDVFVTRRLDSTWLNWSTPENLGPLINTKGGDANFIITASGKYAYFSSTENSLGGWDIFRIELPQEVKPNPVLVVYGTIYNPETNEPIPAKVFYRTEESKRKEAVARNDPRTGKFTVTLPLGKKYVFSSLSDSFYTKIDIIDAESIEDDLEIEHNFQLIRIPDTLDYRVTPDSLDDYPLETTQKVIFERINIYFPYNEYPLPLHSIPAIRYIKRILIKYTDYTLEIIGHTDNIGSEFYNLELSKKRAKSVANFLIAEGIDSKRIKYQGKGMTYPKADNSTQEGRDKNRRVEFIIYR